MRTKILFEDDDIIVCHKPAGLPVQTKKPGMPDMESELKNYFHGHGKQPVIYVVHRLDQPVEGIIVFAKNKNASASLTKQVGLNKDEDKMLKIYEAVIYGKMPSEKGSLKDIIVMDPASNKSFIVKDENEIKAKATKYKPKEARLEYTVISQDEKTSLLRIRLFTGRHHQIRLQMANAGCPLLGDLKYGSEESVNYSKEKNIKNVALKAVSLTFKHPVTGEELNFSLD